MQIINASITNYCAATPPPHPRTTCEGSFTRKLAQADKDEGTSMLGQSERTTPKNINTRAHLIAATRASKPLRPESAKDTRLATIFLWATKILPPRNYGDQTSGCAPGPLVTPGHYWTLLEAPSTPETPGNSWTHLNTPGSSHTLLDFPGNSWTTPEHSWKLPTLLDPPGIPKYNLGEDR